MDTRSLLLLLVLFLGGCTGQSDTCKGKCVCNTQTVNGTAIVINLQNYFTYPVNKTQDFTPGNEKFIYSFSPCQPMSCYPGQPDSAAACQYNTLEGKEYQAVSLGNISDIQYESVEDEYNFVIKITGGAPTPGNQPKQRQTMITFHRNTSTSSNTLRYLQENDKDNIITYNFAADIITVSGGGGGVADGIVGIVLIVIFIVVVATYFIVGGLIMYFMRGARGVEVIPNYTFWKDLPFLIKDGFLFTISPCTKKFSDKGYQAL